MTNRPSFSARAFLGAAVASQLAVVPVCTQATDWDSTGRALQQMGQELQRQGEANRRREQQQERLELERRRTEAAEQQRKDAQQQALQGEQTAREKSEQRRRIAEATPPDEYSGRLAVHREMLQSQLRLFPRELASREQWRYLARVAHILVPSYEEAEEIISRLNNGEPFEVAALRSRDPGSNKKGGDLGWNRKDNFPMEFAEAYSRLDVGQYTRTPVKTQYGWHVLRLLQRYSEDDFLANGALSEFLDKTKKDSFETTDAWRQRVTPLSLNHQITLNLGQYDADLGRFDVQISSVQMSLPMPPEVARSLASTKTVDIEGKLKVLDANFFELSNAKALLPNGKTYSIVAKNCPKTLAEMMDLRAFQHPRLAKLRGQILASSVPETLEKAKLSGFDSKAALQATSEQGQLYLAKSRGIASTDDAAIAGDIGRADNGNLPLNYTCSGPKNDVVCRYIEQKWRALAADALVNAMRCRGI